MKQDLECFQVERLDTTMTMHFYYESLRELTALSKLRLAGHLTSESALQPLSNALLQLQHLKHLELPGQKHKATFPLMDPLCSAIQSLTKLTLLNCKAFHVPSEGYAAFESALQHLPELSILKMSNDPNILGAHVPDLSGAGQVQHIQMAARVHWPNIATSLVASLQVPPDHSECLPVACVVL
jgi:hypothetical protein